MDLKQQLAAVMATLAEKRKAMQTIMTKAATERRTVNDDEEANIQEIEGEIVKLEINENRLRGLIKAAAAAEETTTPVAVSYTHLTLPTICSV